MIPFPIPITGLHSNSATHRRSQSGGDLLAILAGPSPCDDCPNDALCATGRACKDFQIYVQSGSLLTRSRDPSTARYRQLFAKSLD